MKSRFVWIVVFASVVFNHTFLKDQSFRQNVPFAGDIRYSDYLMQKWFFPIVAFLMLAWWLRKQRSILKLFKVNIKYFLAIAVVLLITHFLSFQRWFEFDDYRLIGHHIAVSGTQNYNSMGAVNNPYYGYAFAYTVVSFFERNFVLYNGLGLSILFLIGTVIFLVANKFQTNKVISLIAALVFVTTPTYFRHILQMHEFLGDSFPLLLFVVSVFLLLSKFYAGSIIFAAAALEFGLSREHFIALPLLLTAFLFLKKNKENAKEWTLALLSFPLISLLYLPVFYTYKPQVISSGGLMNIFNQVLRIIDTFFGVVVPHWLTYPVMFTSNFLFPGFLYTSYILGTMLIFSILYLVIRLYRKKKFFEAKIIFVGLVISGASVVFPTFSGIRLVSDTRFNISQYIGELTAAPTSYGLPAAFGLSIMVLGIGLVLKKKIFYVVVSIFIFLNSLSVIKADSQWTKQFSLPQKISNEQLLKIIPESEDGKIIYIGDGANILVRHVSYFYQLYRIKDPFYFTNDPGELLKLLGMYKPETEDLFSLSQDNKTYEIRDNSSPLRQAYENNKLTSFLFEQ